MFHIIPDALKDKAVDTSEQAFTDAGFSVERVGNIIVYERDLSDDVVEAARAFTRTRMIGYRSTDIPSKNCP
jgi:hypothetical protein